MPRGRRRWHATGDSLRDFGRPAPLRTSGFQCLASCDAQGWVNRIRHKDGKNKLELTYKKRYPVQDGDLQAALDLASAEGFGDEEDGWEAEVDWGDGKMTLSFSLEDKAKYPSGVSTMYELSLEDAISLVGAAMPQREDGWLGEDWGTETLADAQLVGPLSYAKYAGTVAGIEVSVEVWPIPDEDGGVRYLTELSFKADKLA